MSSNLSSCLLFTCKQGSRGQVVLMSSTLSSLFVVSETFISKAVGRTGCAFFLFPKHVNKAAGRTGGAYVKQLVFVVSCFRNM